MKSFLTKICIFGGDSWWSRVRTFTATVLIQSLVRELRSHMLNGPVPRHPPHQDASGGLRNLKTVSSSVVQARTRNFFVKVKRGQFVIEWEWPRLLLLARVHVIWPLPDPGQHRFLVSSEGTPWFTVQAFWRSPMRK